MSDRHAFDHHDDREYDALLDVALASYVDAEPDPSMRARIMARIDEDEPRLRRFWLLAPAAACAAAVLAALLLHSTARSPLSSPSTEPAIASAPAPATFPQTVHPDPAQSRLVLPARRARTNKTPARARSDSFPSPSPLTSEEEILLSFATEHPDQARQVLAAPAAGPLESAPLAIASIHIAALSERQEAQHWQ